MEDNAELIALLRKLTPKERETLGWLCSGLTIKDIADRMVCTQSNVLAHLGHIYEKLGLAHLTSAVRRGEIGKFCIAFQQMSQADHDTAPNSSSDAESAAEPEGKAEPVLADVSKRALVAVLTDNDGRYSADLQPPEVEWVDYPAMPRRSRRWLPSLLILFGVALLGSLLTELITMVLPSGHSLLVEEVVVSATPSLALAGVGPTPNPAATIEPRATTVPSALPTPTPLPTPTIPPTATALTGTRNLAGKVPDDIPGVLVAPGVTISSVVDQHTKPRDVYAIKLAAGQVLQFSVSIQLGLHSYGVWIADPDMASFEANPWHGNTFCAYDSISCSDSFTPAASGTYYLGVVALSSNVPYTLRLNVR